MPIKFIYVVLILTLGLPSLWSSLILSQGFQNFGLGNGRCLYVGKLDAMMRYHKNQPGTHIDDGLFVAVPDGGPHNGYSYYELEYHLQGAKDGASAYLPRDPAQFIYVGPPNMYFRDVPGGSIETWGRGSHSAVPMLPDGCILPPGSLFFFWISGGGNYTLGFNTLAELEFSHVVVRAKTVPASAQENLWFEESETTEATYKVYKMLKKEYDDQWRAYFTK